MHHLRLPATRWKRKRRNATPPSATQVQGGRPKRRREISSWRASERASESLTYSWEQSPKENDTGALLAQGIPVWFYVTLTLLVSHRRPPVDAGESTQAPSSSKLRATLGSCSEGVQAVSCTLSGAASPLLLRRGSTKVNRRGFSGRRGGPPCKSLGDLQ